MYQTNVTITFWYGCQRVNDIGLTVSYHIVPFLNLTTRSLYLCTEEWLCTSAFSTEMFSSISRKPCFMPSSKNSLSQSFLSSTFHCFSLLLIPVCDCPKTEAVLGFCSLKGLLGVGPTCIVLICRGLSYAVAIAAPLLLPPAAAWSLAGGSALPQYIQVCSKLQLLPKTQAPLLFHWRQLSRSEDPTGRADCPPTCPCPWARHININEVHKDLFQLLSIA